LEIRRYRPGPGHRSGAARHGVHRPVGTPGRNRTRHFSGPDAWGWRRRLRRKLQAPKSHRGLRPWRRAAHPLRRPLPRHAAGAPARRVGIPSGLLRGPDGPVAAPESPPGHWGLDPDHPCGRAREDRSHRESVPVVSGAGAGLLTRGETMAEQLTDIQTVAMTLYGEARGQSLLDRLAVGAVIRERVLRPGRWGKDWQRAGTAPWQFRSWRAHDDAHRRNHGRMVNAYRHDPDTFFSCLLLAEYSVRLMTDRDVRALFAADKPGEFPTHYRDRSLSGAPKSS